MKKLLAALGLITTGILLNHIVGVAFAVLSLNIPNGPSLGNNETNLFTVATAINGFNQQTAVTVNAAPVGGGQTAATQLSAGLNVVATVTTAGDLVKLPPCNVGGVVYVTNNSANAVTVMGALNRTDTINGTAGATGVSQAGAAHALYFCAGPGATSGAWTTIRATT